MNRTTCIHYWHLEGEEIKLGSVVFKVMAGTRYCCGCGLTQKADGSPILARGG